jgi:ABC-type multidrug transport system ATPase subunit
MAAPAIETQDLEKTYATGVRALADLDLRVEQGEVFGYLGPNGAGKSTTIRLRLDLIRPIRHLSKGNRQKVGLVQAFMHRPQLVVLDEPSSDLDPLLQAELRSLLRETATEGRTVFLSSHSLDEVQHVADRIGIIRSGRLADVDAVERLRERALRHVTIVFAGPADPRCFAALDGVRVEGARRPPPMAVELARRGLLDHRRALAGWCLGVIGYTALVSSIFPSIKASADFEKLVEHYRTRSSRCSESARAAASPEALVSSTPSSSA